MKLSTEPIRTWIFVTGVIRSGTTFLGKVLSLPWEVDYLHEPFHGGYTLPDRVPLAPRYIRPGADGHEVEEYRQQVNKLYKYEIGIKTARHDADPWHRKAIKAVVGSRGPFFLRLAKINPFHRAAIIKDPVARMVSEFLYLEYNTTPVIIIRHPASLAASLRRLDWYPGIQEFGTQDELVQDYFADEPEIFDQTWPNRLLESMAHWRATYKVLLAQAASHGDWQVVTHEALSANPVAEFRKLYQALDLPWSSRIEKKIRAMTEGGSAKARSGQVQDLKRDSSKIFETRRDSIPVEERKQIFDVVKDVALQIYDRESFAID